ncbi:DUF3656 domain-containing protein [Methanolobus sp. ZRKC3]|uniref:DUF3656 domain-containing U32 family peptidase n=1 Tax=Methanolobus sp. ZRKC3 TaxID=3125786 RepID=UPI0032502C04
MIKPELLAPAGNMESLIAAVQNGADAVYLGVEDFSARAYAGNFTLEDFKEALDYAHLRGVKVYVTLNTLIKDSELEKAVNLMYTLDELGTDAIIVQDMGLLSLARKLVPELPVHASTQMTLHNSEAVRFLQDMNVERVVLAREMAIDEIKAIRQETGVEIEAFIHGAMCICYSGQCLMSSMIGGRSGNRGHCAQPCRKKYRLLKSGNEVKAPGKFLLSPKDLNTSKILPELIEAGIDSFKIEGRMKRPEYVAGVVRIYRRLIDRYIENPDRYSVSRDEATELTQLFNREFTSGYFKGNPGDKLMSRERPYNRGILLGKVEAYDRKYRRLDLKLLDKLEVGDGIGFEGSRDAGAIVQRMYRKGKAVTLAGKNELISIPFEEEIGRGTAVYRTQDSSLMKDLQTSYKHGNLRKISVSIKAKAKIGEYFEILILDEDGNEARAVSDYMVEPAQKRASGKEDIKKQLAKLGNTVFEPKIIEIQMEENIFLPIKSMNDARSQAVSTLEKMRVEKWRRNKHSPYLHQKSTAISESCKPLIAVSVDDTGKLQNAISGGADIIYYDVENCSGIEEQITGIQEAADISTVPIYLHSPVIVKDNEMDEFERLILTAKETGFEGVIAANHGTLRRCLESGIRTIADSTLNVFNRETAAVFLDKGSELAVLSPEMNADQIREISQDMKSECIVHGSLQVMESEHGLISGLQSGRKKETTFAEGHELVDEKGFAFLLKTDSRNRTHVFNSKELCMLEDVEQLVKTGTSRLRIDAREMKHSYVEKVTRSYREAVDQCFEATGKKRLHCKNISKEYTRGHFHRGVL